MRRNPKYQYGKTLRNEWCMETSQTQSHKANSTLPVNNQIHTKALTYIKGKWNDMNS